MYDRNESRVSCKTVVEVEYIAECLVAPGTTLDFRRVRKGNVVVYVWKVSEAKKSSDSWAIVGVTSNECSAYVWSLLRWVVDRQTGCQRTIVRCTNRVQGQSDSLRVEVAVCAVHWTGGMWRDISGCLAACIRCGMTRRSLIVSMPWVQVEGAISQGCDVLCCAVLCCAEADGF